MVYVRKASFSLPVLPWVKAGMRRIVPTLVCWCPSTMVYMPPWCIYTVCTRLLSPRVHAARTLTGELLPATCSSHRGFKGERVSKEKEASLSLRINPLPGGNRPNVAKKPATESHCAQGDPEYANPSEHDLKPPLRSWAALSSREEELRP